MQLQSYSGAQKVKDGILSDWAILNEIGITGQQHAIRSNLSVIQNYSSSETPLHQREIFYSGGKALSTRS